MKSHIPSDSLPFFGLGGTTYEKGILQPIMTGRVLLGIILYFFGPYGLNNMKKDPSESSLVCSESLNMNYTKFSFIGLVKLNIERAIFGKEPILS